MADFNYTGFVYKQKIQEDAISMEEMARIAAKYKLSKDYEEKVKEIQYGGSVSYNKIIKMVNYMKQNPDEPVSIASMLEPLGYKSQPELNMSFKAMIDNGVVEPEGGVAPKPKPGEDDGEDEKEPEDDYGITGKELSDDELDAMFAAAQKGGSEEEPEIKATKKEPIKLSGPKMKAAEFMTDNSRLIQSIINNYTTFKAKGGRLSEADDDIKKATEKSKATATEKLPGLIQTLIDKIKNEDPEVQKEILSQLEFSFKSVNYLSIYNKVAKDLNAPAVSPKAEPKKVEPKKAEPEEEDDVDALLKDLDLEETSQIDELDEITLHRFKRYGGLLK